jgi:hypothetical protein
MKSVSSIAAIMVAVAFIPAAAQTQYHSSVTFVNGADQPAVVRLVGPVVRSVPVPTGSSRLESGIAPGRYYIVVRYGDREGHYSYTKGDPFEITETGDAYSEISITLYAVANRNYGSRPARKEDFDRPQ